MADRPDPLGVDELVIARDRWDRQIAAHHARWDKVIADAQRRWDQYLTGAIDSPGPQPAPQPQPREASVNLLGVGIAASEPGGELCEDRRPGIDITNADGVD